MEWQKGDMVINDNLGLAHYAVPGTQGDREKVRMWTKTHTRSETDRYTHVLYFILERVRVASHNQTHARTYT